MTIKLTHGAKTHQTRQMSAVRARKTRQTLAVGARQTRQTSELDEHYALHQIGYSGLPKLKERQLMNSYLDKLLNDFKESQAAAATKAKVAENDSHRDYNAESDMHRDYSGMSKSKERMVMEEYMSNEVLSALKNKTTDFYVESKNVKGPSLGTMITANEEDFNSNVTAPSTSTSTTKTTMEGSEGKKKSTLGLEKGKPLLVIHGPATKSKS